MGGFTCDVDCEPLMSDPRRTDGRRCIDGAVMEARRVTSPATMAARSYDAVFIIVHFYYIARINVSTAGI